MGGLIFDGNNNAYRLKELLNVKDEDILNTSDKRYHLEGRLRALNYRVYLVECIRK
jgi:hypothetical protein